MAESYMDLLQPKLDSLQAALDSFAIIDEHIKDFVNSLNESEGQDIEYTREGFNGISVHRIKKYTDKINEVMQKLTDNAIWMDGVLQHWKDRAASNYIIKTTTSDVSTETVRHRGIRANSASYYTISTVTREECIAVSAQIGADKYIEVHTKIRKSVYQSKSLGPQTASEVLSNGDVSTSESDGPTMHFNFDES